MMELSCSGIRLADIEPLLDGAVPPLNWTEVTDGVMTWGLKMGGTISLTVAEIDGVTQIDITARGLNDAPLSLGVRFGVVTGVTRYLRNGYHSWDGSFFVNPGTPRGDAPEGKQPVLGFAMTALIPNDAPGAVILGFDRHDRFQNRFRYGGTYDAMTIEVETLLDHTGAIATESLFLWAEEDVERALCQWSERAAAASPLPPRLPAKRVKGWCSWYNLYAAIHEDNIREQLAATTAYRDAHGIDLDIFMIDDGFTPEMGDWLDVKPQFPHGMAPLLNDIEKAGFTPGLWIAPFTVGNRSRLFTEHPDWVVRDRDTGAPIVQMTFYGEFRWHKRSEEYYILDITHPDAEAYMRKVFRTWAKHWGARYFKADFLFFGAEYGPDRAVWHQPGLSRIAIWRRMMTVMREEIGDALLLGCGCPLWSSVGLVDAVRIGRDVGVKWSGDQSAESLLRDQATRNHAAGTLWQADPDCILLRDRFHHLTDAQINSLALLAGLSGGVLMSSDDLDKLTPERAHLLDALAELEVQQCRYPSLGNGETMIVQHTTLCDGRVIELRLDPETGESICTGAEGLLPS